MALIDLKTNLAKRIEYDKQDLSIQRVSNAQSNYDKFQPDDGQFIQKTLVKDIVILKMMVVYSEVV